MGKTKTAFVGETLEEEKKKRKKEEPKKVHIAGLKGGQRVKIISAEEPASLEIKGTEIKAKKEIEERIRGKKYRENLVKVDKNKLYPLKEAIKLVKDTSYSKFDGTVELHLVLKKVGASANVTLPYSAGKTKKIEVASDETIKKLEGGKIDFDVLLATAEMMPKLVPYAKVLGPKGLMPNPKNGTLIKSEKEAEKFSENTLNLKTEKEAPLIHTIAGKVSQSDKELIENTEAIFKILGGPKQITKAYVKATMSPSIKVGL